MKQALVDSGFIIALEYARDENHSAAIDYWDRQDPNSSSLLTTTFILDEIVTWFNSRGRHAKAVEIGNGLFASAAIELVFVDEDLLNRGWEFLCRHSDKTYSLTDCISFVLMQHRGLSTALSFDHHFTQAGFHLEPS